MKAKKVLTALSLLGFAVCVVFLFMGVWLGLFFAVMVTAFWLACLGEEIKSQKSEITDRLEYLRTELRNERISYDELFELQSLIEYIDPDDVELLEAAGVGEFEE